MGALFSLNENFADLCAENKCYQSYFIHKTYQPTECVRQMGDSIEYFGIVTEGILKAVSDTVGGMELCHTYFQSKDIFPELLYFSGKRHYAFSLYAVKKTKVIWIPVEIMEEMLSSDPQLMYSFILCISQRGLKDQLFLNCLNYHTIRQRIAFWIVGMHDITMNNTVPLTSSQSILANMLHVSRASLNKELNLMDKEGFFTIADGEVRDIDFDRLSELI